MYGDWLAESLMWVLGIAIAIGFALGAMVFWLLPIFWHWLAPHIHAWTA